MNKNIVILGCPRSGTSLIAQLVKNVGYDADNYGTRELMKPNKDFNPDGYFERIDIVRTNDTLIHLIDKQYSFLNPPSLEEVIRNNTSHQSSIDVSNELKSYNGWFIKDSRLCFTLNIYDFNNINVIKVVRNPESVKRSMIRHYGNIFEQDGRHGPHIIKKVDFEEYYDNINKCIDWQANKFPNITIKYEDIMDGNTKSLEEFLESKIDRSIINPKYRNYAL